ncbi:MAG TPA: response regulator [Ktedonobacteraceae bacterium]|nr:response regulator [Ktedonobacteraceae bacterium]
MSGKRVLIVDDDEDMQVLLQTVLENQEYEVVTAEDGLAALEELEKSAPDLILLDLMMPRMDGYAFTEELRQRGLQSTIPIIVISADVNAKQNTEQLGADSYIAKPFDVRDLLGEISHLMEHLIPEEKIQEPQARGMQKNVME